MHKYVSIFDERISLGIFEIDSNNNLVKSYNYTEKEPIIQLDIVTFNLDSVFTSNGDTMIKTRYVYTFTYGEGLGILELGEFFANKVKTGGSWDYKQQLGTKKLYRARVNGATVDMAGEDIGNANYGFAGRKGFSAKLLRTAAGAYQICSRTSELGWYKTYFDDPNDQYWINRGINYSEGKGF
ncbi:polymorphic toxin type 44 domain-containing protein [Clostridium oryzae]|uniref:Bacterial toxin 44 domain-containing protein n=1 Tax=Clostridium oryzae TaxID=1450648 RepID=A0A1V4ITM9_9CLOT|nr:polymorphic toxin type 44 domain-containing protein [Clostridium oryzae]OPJ63391.1 hypothetical protein CLORY_11730 [Clostridium oryzae]